MKDLHQKKSKLSTFRNKNIHHHILLFLISPNYDYHTERLISTERFSVGHFWSPFHTIIEGIFR